MPLCFAHAMSSMFVFVHIYKVCVYVYWTLYVFVIMFFACVFAFVALYICACIFWMTISLYVRVYVQTWLRVINCTYFLYFRIPLYKRACTCLFLPVCDSVCFRHTLETMRMRIKVCACVLGIVFLMSAFKTFTFRFSNLRKFINFL